MSDSTPPGGAGLQSPSPSTGSIRNPSNEETTVLTPVGTGTSPIDRIPLSHRKRWIVVTTFLSMLLVAAIAFIVYLWDVSRAWEDQVAQLDATSHDLGERLAAEQSEVVRLQQQLDITTEQLATAQKRITELADLNARTGDDVQYYVQEINRQRELVTMGSTVAAALNRCVEGQQQLVVYIRNAANYDPAELAEYEATLKRLCDSAVAANVTFQQALTQ